MARTWRWLGRLPVARSMKDWMSPRDMTPAAAAAAAAAAGGALLSPC
jgi:hypothetical protein